MSGSDEHQAPLAKRLLWFVALWLGGVLAVGAIGFVLRRILIG